MSSSFKSAFPVLVSFFEEFFSLEQQVPVEQAVKTLIERQEFERIYDLLCDMNRFNVSETSPPVKTKDLLFFLNNDLSGLNPIGFLQYMKFQLRIGINTAITHESVVLNNAPSKEKKYYYLLKWEIKLKSSFLDLIKKEGDNLSPVSLYVLTEPMLVSMRWKDGELLDGILGIERTTKGHMNLNKQGEQYSLDKNLDFSLAFWDGSSEFVFSCNLKFINNRPFYEFPSMLSYDDMAIIEKHLFNNFPIDELLRELSI